MHGHTGASIAVKGLIKNKIPYIQIIGTNINIDYRYRPSLSYKSIVNVGNGNDHLLLTITVGKLMTRSIYYKTYWLFFYKNKIYIFINKIIN